MKTNGLELNVNDLIDEVIRLTEEKMLAEFRAERQEVRADGWKKEHETILGVLEAYENKAKGTSQ